MEIKLLTYNIILDYCIFDLLKYEEDGQIQRPKNQEIESIDRKRKMELNHKETDILADKCTPVSKNLRLKPLKVAFR